MYNLNMEEIWKTIPKLVIKSGREFTPDRYEVSNLGRIRTKKQRYGQPRKDLGNKRGELTEYRYLTGRPDQAGYMQVDLFDANSVRSKYRIHTIVMQTFIGLPEAGQVICHYDDIKTNNQLTNLRYDTYKANNLDKVRNKKLSLIS
jgi:hypothetical protein